MTGALRRVRGWTGRRLARAYVAGPSVAEALGACRRARARGWAGTVAFWNGPDDTPSSVARQCRTALDSILDEGLNCHLSVKPPAFAHDPVVLQELAARAGPSGLRVHLDSHGPASADHSFRLIEAVLPRHPNLGCSLPARWRRSAGDAERAVEWGIAVRVVKGQWPDALADVDPRRGFLALVDRLAGRAARVLVATHDAELARAALERLREAGTPCELEQLFGLPVRERRAARPLGVSVRIYVPYGHPCLPYQGSPGRAGVFASLVRDAFAGWR